MRALSVILALLVLVCGALFARFWTELHHDLHRGLEPGAPSVILDIAAADEPGPVWRQLVAAGVARHSAVLAVFFEDFAAPRAFPAGEVAVSASQPILEQLDRVAAGEPVTYPVNLPAAAPTELIASRLAAAGIVSADDFLWAARRHDAARLRGLEASSLDGFLYPDLYAFPHHESPERVLDAMVERFFEAVRPADWAAAEAHGLDAASWVRLAALLEAGPVPKDTWRLQAAMLRNRQRQGLSLAPAARAGGGAQLLYGFQRGRVAWPRPTINPGLDALRAAARPADSSSLFLVRRPNGELVYSVDVAGVEEAMTRP